MGIPFLLCMSITLAENGFVLKRYSEWERLETDKKRSLNKRTLKSGVVYPKANCPTR